MIPLVALLRQRAGASRPEVTRWVHRGLTSQDVLDSALMLCCRDVLARIDEELRTQIGTLAELADRHRETVMAGRTLTQHAVPTTFGLKATGWLRGSSRRPRPSTLFRAGSRFRSAALPARSPVPRSSPVWPASPTRRRRR